MYAAEITRKTPNATLSGYCLPQSPRRKWNPPKEGSTSTCQPALGMEGAGTVEAIGGEGVTDLTVGQPVVWCLALGSYAQYVRVPAWRVVPVPKEISRATAAGLMLQGCTAHYLTHSTLVIKSGDSCLAHAGAGGVGQLLIQLAKRRGVQRPVQL